MYQNDEVERSLNFAAAQDDSHRKEFADIQVLISYPYESGVDENVENPPLAVLGAMHRGDVKHSSTLETLDFLDLYESSQHATAVLAPKLQTAENVY